MTKKYAGGAVASYRAIDRASAVFSGRSSLTSVIAFLGLLESIVLYDRLWYLPFGDPGSEVVAGTDLWNAMTGLGLIVPIDEAILNEDSKVLGSAREAWKRQLASLHIPSYGHVSRTEFLDNVFEHAMGAQVWAYDDSGNEDEQLTADGLSRWVDHVTGVGFDQAEQDANDGEDDGRYMNWERAAVYMARATVVGRLDCDYVGDAIEDPIVRIVNTHVNRNAAARLYARLSDDFRANISALVADGLPVVLPVPPIAALLLERSAGGLDSILTEAVALRDEFSPFRKRYRQYAESLRNPTGMTLTDLMGARREALDEVEGALGKIGGGRTDSRLISEIVGATLKPSDDQGVSLEIEPSLSLTSLAKVGVQRFTLSRIKGRAKMLFDAYGKAMQIRNYHSLIDNALSVNVTVDEYESYVAYTRAVEKLSGGRQGK
ncbi:hypothetical protein [Achromobacter deleyi]|uniref:hypothetical protein n=1 Tax=Achromobacter deleyi TaxID=1353891 RepID=UPI001492252C|nr:hypothetical protein [Achromobacter deleyi]QVQ27789.1 hypothetical protein HLG70_04905 [Achromobacter deleyi]UIP23392.1 hypothetical protein LYZ39_13020 [Achromobacter deleyi]